MKNLITIALCLSVINIYAQIGIGTTSPNSTLDVRGSISLNYRSFSSSTTAATTDNTLVFTGSTAATITLPDAGNCAGRMYAVKNSSTTLPTPVLTIATTSSQTIDGGASWSLDVQNEMIELVSNGANWNVTGSNPARTRSNYVLVKAATDFPAAVGGVITLSPTTLYEINGTIVLTNKIDLNGAYITGIDAVNDKLVYTPSSGELFTGANGGNIKLVTLIAAAAGSKVFNIDGANGNKNLTIQSCYILGSDNIGLLKGLGGTVYLNAVIFMFNNNGIIYQDIGNILTISSLWDSTNHNVYEKFVGSFRIIQKLVGGVCVKSANTATGLDVSGITSINGSATLKTTSFVGDGTYVTGSFSSKWEVETYGLNTEKDDVASGDMYISSPVTTTFTAVNTPTKVLGTTSAINLFRVTSPVDNKLIYTGSKSKKFLVIVSLSLTASANNKVFSFYIAKNGAVVPGSKQTRKMATGADQGAVPLSCIINLATNDYLEVWVENNTDNTSMTVQSLNLAIK